MLTSYNCYFFTLVLLLISLSSCQIENKENLVENIDSYEIEDFELFADFEQHGLAGPVQIEVLANGNIAVLDYRMNKVLILNSGGELLNSFGGEGRGPGEFLSALQMQKSDEYLYIVDSDLLQVNQFNYSGDFIQSFNFDTGIFRRYVTVLDNDSYFTETMGKNGKLVRKAYVDTDSSYYFGEAMGDEYKPGDLEIERKVLLQGKIPEVMKNQITKYYSNNHLYVFLDLYSRLQKYTKEGKLVWDVSINMPVNQIIFDKGVERAKEPEAIGGVPVIRYILSMKTVKENSYLLWFPADEHPQYLVKIDENGKKESIFNLQNDDFVFLDFSIDLQNNFIYLIESNTSQVYRAKLP